MTVVVLLPASVIPGLTRSPFLRASGLTSLG